MLSGGQQQRVAIARALVNKPRMILADEPTGNLDSKSGADIIDLLSALHQGGQTVIIVTHDAEIAKRAQRGIVLKDGAIVVDRSVAKIK
jgi:putative ABC transport system ATP-binding protein